MHWNNKKKHTSLMIADRSHNKNEELGYLCVCARARVSIKCMREMPQKRKKTAGKNLQEQSVRRKKKGIEISEREISEREIHFTIHIRERRSTQAV